MFVTALLAALQTAPVPAPETVPAPAPAAVPAPAARPFRIEVVDAATGRGVPLVELETVHGALYVTDNAGVAAVQEPGLEGEPTWFHVRSHGYRVPADGFGNRGFRATVAAGGSFRYALERVNVAERLYRLTGAGRYRDSVLLGDRPPLAAPLLNGGVLGQDSVVNALYGGRLYWFWGDTERASYPLGQFAVSGATSALPADGGLDPAVGVDLDYFVDADGFSRRMCPIDGPGPVWIFGLMVVEQEGRERMAAHYARMQDLGTMLEHGIVLWNDAREVFEKAVEFPLDAPLYPRGHALKRTVDGVDWFYFTTPFPDIRVRATLDAILDPAAYEAVGGEAAGGAPRTLVDVETGAPVRTHGGSVAWNAHRGKWVMLALEHGGRSMLGEVWYAEADAPEGPWSRARRVVTHDRYSFYNLRHHPYFDDGRWLYFEGTYTAMFSGATRRTPRYDYNQVMYRLDLDDPRLQGLAAPAEGDAPR